MRFSKPSAFSIVFFFYLVLVAAASGDDQNPVSAEAPTQFTLESYDASKAFRGYTLYSYTGEAKVHLLDPAGAVVHTWNVDATRARLLSNCNLLVVHGTDWGKRTEPWKSLRRKVREYSWDGKVVWEFEAPSIAHHDVNRLANGNTLFPVRVNQKIDVKAEGSESAHVVRKNRSDTLIEADVTGKVSWKWDAHEHLDLDSCGARECNKPLIDERWAQVPRDWTHINTTNELPANKWFRSGDRRFHPGNVLVTLRNWWQVLLINHETKEVIWKYSGDYKGGIIAAHEAHMIPEPLPGAGNILLFDNGGRVREETYILEINPLTQKVVWKYDDGKNFYVAAKGAVQRLPNGNTLISTGAKGRVFEVTPQGQIVWDLKGNRDVNRANKYSPGYCPKLL